jgi:spermidine synthase
VDISSSNVKMALKHLKINEGLKRDDRFNFFIDDAFNYVKYTKKRYDLIQIDSNPPFYSHNCATLYTETFYRLCKAALAEKGLFTQVLPIKQLTNDEMRSVMNTFSTVFPHCILWWNGLDPIMIGSERSYHLDTEQISERLTRPGINRALAKFSFEAKYDTLGHFISGLMLSDEDFRSLSASGKLNTTDLNYLEYSTELNIDYKNSEDLTAQLTGWSEVEDMFTEPTLITEYAEQLTSRRKFLMGVMKRKMYLSKIRL